MQIAAGGFHVSWPLGLCWYCNYSLATNTTKTILFLSSFCRCPWKRVMADWDCRWKQYYAIMPLSSFMRIGIDLSISGRTVSWVWTKSFSSTGMNTNTHLRSKYEIHSASVWRTYCLAGGPLEKPVWMELWPRWPSSYSLHGDRKATVLQAFPRGPRCDSAHISALCHLVKEHLSPFLDSLLRFHRVQKQKTWRLVKGIGLVQPNKQVFVLMLPHLHESLVQLSCYCVFLSWTFPSLLLHECASVRWPLETIWTVTCSDTFPTQNHFCVLLKRAVMINRATLLTCCMITRPDIGHCYIIDNTWSFKLLRHWLDLYKTFHLY